MERELFDWDNWDELDPGVMMFYPCTLKVQIGNYHPGSIVNTVIIDNENSQLRIVDSNGNTEATFQLHYLVGEQVDSSTNS